MKKFTEQSMTAIVIEIILILGLLLGLGLLINSWIKKHKLAKDEDAVTNLSHDTALSSTAIASTVSGATTLSDIDRIKKITENFKVQPIANAIRSSKGVTYDNEESAISAIGELKNKVELSILSTYFLKLYGESLMTFLTSFMNLEQLRRVADIVAKLPKY